MDSDTSTGSKRRIPNKEEPLLQQHQVEEELDKEPLFFGSLSSVPFQDGLKAPTSEVSSRIQEQEIIPDDSFSPKSLKKSKCSPSGVGDREDVLNSVTQEKAVLCDSVSGCSCLEGISEDFAGKVETFGVGVQETCYSKVGFSSKEETCGGRELYRRSKAIKVNGDKKNKKKQDRILESKKKKLLAEVEGGSLLMNKSCQDVGGLLNPSGGILEGLKGVDESVRSSLNIEVIDDTALLVLDSVAKSGNCGVKIAPRDGKKNDKGETNGKKARAAYQRRLEGKKNLETSGMQKKDAQMGEVGKEPMQVVVGGNGGIKNEERMKIKYSRDEMETLRFVNIVEQRKLWRDIYTGFEGSVLKGYDDLASSKHQNDIRCNFNPRPPSGRKGGDAGILGPFAARGRWTRVNIYVQ